MINHLFTKEFTVLRQVENTEGEIYSSGEESIGTFKGYIQQASPEYVLSLGLTITKPHLIWCPLDTDVKEGDVVLCDLGELSIRGVQLNRDGVNKHKELVAEHFELADEPVGS